MFNIVVVLCLIPVFEVFGGNSLPPYIKTCKRQPDLFPCLKENAELCRPNLAKGIPELYIPPLVPFVLPNVKLEHTGFTLDVKDLAIEGLQTFEMKRMDIKFESDFLMHAEIKLPTFLATGTYTIKGKLLMLELNGHGNGEANATPYIKTCKRQPDLFPCLKENADLCRPHLDKGIPELFLPSFTPFKVPKVTLQGSGFTFEVKNFTIDGLQNFELLGMYIKMDSDFSLHADIKIPNYKGAAMYTFQGKILMLELNGQGFSELNATYVQAKVDVTGTKVTKKGMEYADIKDGTIALTFGPLRVYFHNLFGDREDLTKATNEVINENYADFLKELQPMVEEVILSILMGVLKPLFNKYPLDELFPK